MKSHRIAVAGTGYVGLSLATLLAQHNHVTAVDVIPDQPPQVPDSGRVHREVPGGEAP